MPTTERNPCIDCGDLGGRLDRYGRPSRIKGRCRKCADKIYREPTIEKNRLKAIAKAAAAKEKKRLKHVEAIRKKTAQEKKKEAAKAKKRARWERANLKKQAKRHEKVQTEMLPIVKREHESREEIGLPLPKKFRHVPAEHDPLVRMRANVDRYRREFHAIWARRWESQWCSRLADQTCWSWPHLQRVMDAEAVIQARTGVKIDFSEEIKGHSQAKVVSMVRAKIAAGKRKAV